MCVCVCVCLCVCVCVCVRVCVCVCVRHTLIYRHLVSQKLTDDYSAQKLRNPFVRYFPNLRSISTTWEPKISDASHVIADTFYTLLIKVVLLHCGGFPKDNVDSYIICPAH